MKVSARNVFPGTVSQVREGAVNAEVTLTLTGGTELVAVVTLDSVKSLELAPGTSAVALVKAPWVMVMSADSGLRLSARNCLAGTVESISDGAVNRRGGHRPARWQPAWWPWSPVTRCRSCSWHRAWPPRRCSRRLM